MLSSIHYALCSICVVLFLAGCAADSTRLPVHLTVATGEVGVPTTAVGADGTVYWTWFGKDDDGAMNVYLARLEPGSETPAAPVRVNAVPGNANMHTQAPAQVAAGPEGQVYVAWTNRIDVEGRRFPASDLLFARSTDSGQTFGPTVTVNDDAGGLPTGHTFHDLAAAPDGTIYVSWIDTREVDKARRQQVPTEHTGADHATAGDGHMHGHSNTAQEGPGPQIRVARSTDGGQTFSPSVVVDGNSCPCCRTSLVVADDGTIYLGWRKVFDGDIRDMVVARSTDGGRTFSEPVRVHKDGWHINGCPHSGPALTVDGEGRVHVAWYTGAEDGVGVFYAVSDDGARSFAAPQALLTDVPVTQVRLATDREGVVWMAWEDKSAKAIRLAHTDGGKVIPLGEELAGDLPALAVHGPVRALVWEGAEGLESRVAFD